MPSMAENIRRIATFILTGFLVVAGAILYWQVLRAPGVTSRPENARRIEDALRIRRGQILARNGEPLAKTELTRDGYAHRIYTDPRLAHVVGFVNQQVGPTGIEQSFDDYLTGRAGADPQAMLASRLFHRPSVGNDVVLTIDPRLQQVAERMMGDDPGAAVVLDPRTGEILAMVSNPTFDPNALVFNPAAPRWSAEQARVARAWEELRNRQDGALLNRATQGLYPPGSVFKTVTLAAALERGIARPDTIFKLDLNPPGPGQRNYWHENQYVECANHPQDDKTLTLAGAYAWSCNVIFSELALKVGPDDYLDTARRFGMNEAPPLEIPTAVSEVYHTKGYFGGNERIYALASTGMGQGQLRVTPLEMALIAAGIANHGEIPQPHLVREVRRPDGTIVLQTAPRVWRAAVHPTIAEEIRSIMVTSVQDGWARPAAIPGIPVAGKTGTAEPGVPGKKTHAWFIGFAPADQPRVVVAVVKEYAGDGASVSAPVARAIFEAALGLPTATR